MAGMYTYVELFGFRYTNDICILLRKLIVSGVHFWENGARIRYVFEATVACSNPKFAHVRSLGLKLAGQSQVMNRRTKERQLNNRKSKACINLDNT